MKSKRSQRLSKALELALPGVDLWDVGCDHGYLGYWAGKSKQYAQVHCVDPVTAPMEKLNLSQLLIKKWPCKVEEVDEIITGNFIFLGVGAQTQLTAIFNLQKKSRFYPQKLILGPHKDASLLESTMIPDYRFVEVVTVLERGRARPLYVFDRVADS